MRFLALVMMAAIPAAVQAQAVKWADTVTLTAQGGVLIGNPKAAVKLVEFGSLTCSHCGAFHKTGLPALKARYLNGGKVSYEFRSFVRNGPDFAASLIAGCLPAKAQLGMIDQLFAEQDKWLMPFTTVQPAEMAAVAALPMPQQFVKLAALGKLDGWAAGKGVPAAKANQCLADTAKMDQLAATRTEAVETYGLEGTPTFVLNGKTVPESYDWASLEPKLQAALK